MARQELERTATPSVLDRLVDLEPQNQQEAPMTQAQSIRKVKAAVRRDLEWLFNTRRVPALLPESCEALRRSLWYYGLPDITSFTFNSLPDRLRLTRTIEDVVATFEPRLANVRVRLVDQSDDNKRMLRFQIDGLLKMDPTPEPITFDTVLQLVNGEYQVKGDSGA